MAFYQTLIRFDEVMGRCDKADRWLIDFPKFCNSFIDLLTTGRIYWLLSACNSFGQRPVRWPCKHALLLDSMCTRKALRSPIKITSVEVSL